ncbi:MAG: dUTP diphosphatase [Parachlamydiales bacterium]|jgi:dUTP pyrophosphatase
MENNPHSVNIHIELSEGAELPHYATSGAAGCDLRAFLKSSIILDPGMSALIPTGIRVSIPHGYEIQIRPRSGLALKEQVTVLNTPGTIDSDYRGEIGVILINHSTHLFIVEPGMRIAQMVVAPVCRAEFVLNAQLAETERGVGGFGHTGRH